MKLDDICMSRKCIIKICECGGTGGGMRERVAKNSVVERVEKGWGMAVKISEYIK